jgi:cyclic nucleotide gated channel
MQYMTDDYHSSDIEEEEEEDEELGEEVSEEEEEKERGDNNGSDCKNIYFMCGPRRRRGEEGWSLGPVLDPRAKWVQEWNRVFLLVCATGLFLDPLFFYALSISDTCMCLFIDGWFAITVTVLRCMTDALHVWNMWLQLKMANRSFAVGATAGLRDTCPRTVALRYLKAKRGFLFDLFVIFPLPQVRISVIYIHPHFISYLSYSHHTYIHTYHFG